jgi:hypothetical protein
MCLRPVPTPSMDSARLPRHADAQWYAGISFSNWASPSSITMLPARVYAADPWSSRTPWPFARAGWIILVVLLGMPHVSSHAQRSVSEQTVKAAYLFNFGKFLRAETPPRSSSFDICLFRDEDLGQVLEPLTANEQLNGRPIHVRHLKGVQDAQGCSVTYIGASEGSRVEADLAVLRGEPVLTVSDSPDFLKHGGMIQFLIIEKHVRFAVNLQAVRGANLNLSSELLRVAVSVTGMPGGAR